MSNELWSDFSNLLEEILKDVENKNLSSEEQAVVEQVYSLYQKTAKLSGAMSKYDGDEPFERMKLKEDEWHLADTGVFCRCLGNHEFEFITSAMVGEDEEGYPEYLVDNQLIDIGDYSDEDIEY